MDILNTLINIFIEPKPEPKVYKLDDDLFKESDDTISENNQNMQLPGKRDKKYKKKHKIKKKQATIPLDYSDIYGLSINNHRYIWILHKQLIDVHVIDHLVYNTNLEFDSQRTIDSHIINSHTLGYRFTLSDG